LDKEKHLFTKFKKGFSIQNIGEEDLLKLHLRGFFSHSVEGFDDSEFISQGKVRDDGKKREEMRKTNEHWTKFLAKQMKIEGEKNGFVGNPAWSRAKRQYDLLNTEWKRKEKLINYLLNNDEDKDYTDPLRIKEEKDKISAIELKSRVKELIFVEFQNNPDYENFVVEELNEPQ